MANSSAVVQKEAGEISRPEATRGGYYYTPRVDIYETDDELVFLCDLPGVRPEDIDLRFERGELTLHGRVRPRQEGVRYLLNEYGVGDFYRSFTVHEELDANQITADFKHGVLTVHLPKREEAKPRKIAIKAS
jgi:HSP20 family protein